MSRAAPMVTANCLICSKPFQVSSTRAKHGRGKHCSPACQYESNRRRPKKLAARLCIGCGSEFQRNPGHLTGKKGAGKYCSRACRNKNRAGELHPQYLGTRARSDYGANWQAQKRRARHRDKYCQRCGSKRGPLDVHHKIPIRLWANKEAANDLGNRISLCRACHRTVEAKTAWAPVDGGVLAFVANGAAHELARERGLMRGLPPGPDYAPQTDGVQSEALEDLSEIGGGDDLDGLMSRAMAEAEGDGRIRSLAARAMRPTRPSDLEDEDSDDEGEKGPQIAVKIGDDDEDEEDAEELDFG